MAAVPAPGAAAADVVDVVVVGAGFAGMYMLHTLRRMGRSAVVFERGDDVGGTWYWNRYPGARCDLDSMNYSYSFDAELEQEWEWNERFATQPEILRYANHVADRFDLRRDIRFATSVTSAHFDEMSGRWTVGTDRGETVSSQFLIMAVGCLSTSKTPEIPGVDDFAGRTYHTGHWPHEGVDFTGQRVGVIGTGSSGIQAIPLIAEQASRLTVFQRTAGFSLPAKNALLDPDDVAALKARYPEHREVARRSSFGVPIPRPEKLALEVSEEERNDTYRRAFEKGGLFDLVVAYRDLMHDEDANATAANYVRSRIRGIVEDPALADALSPKGFPFGAKRPCLDTNYYATYNRPNVELVDLRRTPLEAITPAGVRTSAYEFAFDSIVFATGFDAMTGSLLAFDIVGRDGLRLKDKWAAGPRTYLGLATAGFPNLFIITGPGSPSVLSNMILSIEQHVDWIAGAMAAADARDCNEIEATPDAEETWTIHVDDVGKNTLYPAADSWYMGANVPGKPRLLMPYVGGAHNYRASCERVVADGYAGFVMSNPGDPHA